MNTQTIIQIKTILLLALISAAVARYILASMKKERAVRWLERAMFVFAIVAIFGFFQFGKFVRGNFLNYHDVFHYYFGSKYSQELGYEKLYLCSLVALNERAPKAVESVHRIRSLSTYKGISKKSALSQRRNCRKRFTSARWKAFKSDLDDFRQGRALSWPRMLYDKGYNPTPVWNMFGKMFSSAIPIKPWWVFNLLGFLDLALLAIALALVGLAFGPWGLVATIVFLGASYELHQTHIRGGFLRLDWLAALLAGAALLKMERFRSAGAVLAYSAMVRVFPVIFLFGVGVAALRELWRNHRIAARHLRFFGAFSLTAVLLFGASVANDRGIGQWREFFDKIQSHDGDISPKRVGFKYVLLYQGEKSVADYRGADGKIGFRPAFVEKKQQLYAHLLPTRILVVVATMLLLGLLLWNIPEHESLVLGFPLMFLLTAPTFYYWTAATLAVPVLATAVGSTKMPRLAPLLAFCALIVHNAGIYLIMKSVRFDLIQHYFYSVSLGLLSVFILVVYGLERAARSRFAAEHLSSLWNARVRESKTLIDH